jgi:chromosome segregation ATPase
MKIPTLSEIYPELVKHQTMKQQTSLLTAILELHESLRNLNKPDQVSNDSSKIMRELDEAKMNLEELQLELNALKQKPQLRVQQLEEMIVGLQTEIKALHEENQDLNRELDLHEQAETEFANLNRELDFQKERFKTLQEHYKNSTDYAKSLQNELVATKEQRATINLSKPKGFKSWEDAAMTERLHHNQTKTELQNAATELSTTKIKLERFQNLFKQALGE